MKVIGSVLWESQISSLLRNLRCIGEVSGDNSQSSGTEFTTGGIDRYIAATGMDCDKTWGSEVEIMVLSHLLNAAVTRTIQTMGGVNTSQLTFMGDLTSPLMWIL